MTHEEMIEAVARAWCEASGKDPDKLTPAPRGVVGLVPLWTLFEPQARAAIRVIAPAVLEEAAIMMTPTNPKSDWTDYARNKARWADDIRALKTRYE